MSSFRVGQKVVCINGSFSVMHPKEVSPVKGNVYTIRSVVLTDKMVTLQFDEIRNPPLYSGGAEASFNSSKFRPVIERKTDIAIFKAMLTPSKQNVEA